jgi:urea carboxylase/allophanate hydrolase
MLVGNDPGVEGFEITYSGPTILFHHAAVIALCGAEFEFTINGANAQTWTRYSIQPGSEIVIGSHTSVGCRAYLAVLGGLPNM